MMGILHPNLRRVRAGALPKLKGGLRARYRILELPAADLLKDAPAAVDTAVLAAYGFSAKMDLLAQLLALSSKSPRRSKKANPLPSPACRPAARSHSGW